MKRLGAICIVTALLLTGCSVYDRKTADEEEVYVKPEYIGEKPKLIVNCDFRTIYWGMSPADIQRQEQEYEDIWDSDSLVYWDMEYAGCDAELRYIIEDGMCNSAEYRIPADEYRDIDAQFLKVTEFLDRLYGEADETEGCYKTDTADVYTGIGDEYVYVRFKKPEKDENPLAKDRVIYYGDDNEVSSVSYVE